MAHDAGAAPAGSEDGYPLPGDGGQPETGERVLAHSLRLAQLAWGDRLVAAYALGSLAHGGFSAHVSDVDLALVVANRLDDEDAAAVRRLLSNVKGSGVPLADRLSVFWGCQTTLAGAAGGGRFPPVDLLDLKQFGRLLAGRDIRAGVRSPTTRELIVSGAAFAHRILSGAETTAYLRNPAGLASANVRTLTKLTLYPVRLLYTARTGQVGINHKAVGHFVRSESGPAAELARSGLAWRYNPPVPGSHSVAKTLEKGMLRLYQAFVDDHEKRLRDYGELDLAQAYRDWRQRLD